MNEMMKDDEILKRLQEAAKEQATEDAGLDARLDALAFSELDGDQEAELRDTAEGDEKMAAAYEAFRPLDQGFRENMVDRLQKEIGAADRSTKKKDHSSTVIDLNERRAQRRRKLGWIGGLAVGAAAAAAITLTVLPSMNQPGALPPYSIMLNEGVQQIRGTADKPHESAIPRYTAGALFEITLRPEQAVQEAVEVKLYLQRGDDISELKAPVEIDPQGSVRVSGVLGKEITIPPGDWTLLVAIANPGQSPHPGELVREEPGPSNHILLKAKIHINE